MKIEMKAGLFKLHVVFISKQDKKNLICLFAGTNWHQTVASFFFLNGTNIELFDWKRSCSFKSWLSKKNAFTKVWQSIKNFIYTLKKVYKKFFQENQKFLISTISVNFAKKSNFVCTRRNWKLPKSLAETLKSFMTSYKKQRMLHREKCKKYIIRPHTNGKCILKISKVCLWRLRLG